MLKVAEVRNMYVSKPRALNFAMVAAIAAAFAATSAIAAGGASDKLPSTSIVPASGSGAGPASSSSAAAPSVPAIPPVPPPPAPAPGLPASAGAASNPAAGEPAVASTASAKPKATSHRLTEADREVEPAKAQIKLVKDDWVYSEPSKWSKHIERVHSGKFVNVTGSTRAYLQVKLKSGAVGYLDPSAVDLIKSTDKIFTLTRDAAVLEKPNKWSKKLAEVHRQHPVHVVGISLNYARIKMRNGTEGYIPLHALE